MQQLKTTTAFTSAYQALNPNQKQAVDTLEGPVMVVAGPGTGKTQVLTTRIANILLKTDTNPSSILALTYTDSAAKHMRQRLVQLIGKTGYYVNINTFHAFCSEVIRHNPEYFALVNDSEALTELERYDLFEQLLNSNQLEYLKPLNAPYLYLKHLIKAISNLKREGINPKQFAQIVEQEEQAVAQELQTEKLTKAVKQKKQKNLNKQKELLKLYQQYQQELAARQRYDFDDMVMFVVEAFSEHELLLREHQERLQYILVDEYQDTNNSQNRVVDLLASYWGEQANVFVVGDPHQAIYRFQGASIKNMLSFVDRYPQGTVINLEQGYRCPQKIYDAAYQLISNNRTDEKQEQLTNNNSADAQSNQTQQQTKQKLLALLNQPLNSAQTVNKPGEIKAIKPTKTAQLKLFSAPVQTLETIFVARQIKQLIEKGTEPDQIAVLYRYNADSVELTQALSKWGIRYQIDGGDDILKSEFINQLLNFFQVLLDLRPTKEDELVYKTMHYPWFALDTLAVMKLGRVAGKLKLSLLEVIDRGYEFIVEKKQDQVISQDEFTAIAEFVQQLYQFSSLDHTLTFTAWFEQILKESGVFAWVRSQPQQVELINELNSLYNEIKSMVASNHKFKLADFLHTIQVMQEHKLQITAEDLNITHNAVHLSTVHKAKGREWQHVFVLQCINGKWGNRRQVTMIPLPVEVAAETDITQEEANEDERRVFYVALTRASQTVTLSYPETITADNRTDEKIPSLFLSELGAIKEVQDETLTNQADQFLQKLIEPAVIKIPSKQELAFFKNLVQDFKLSVTALNSYLRDPQEFVENNLLRLPRAKALPMAFGTAVHTALEQYYQAYMKQNQRPSEQSLLTSFEKALQKEVLTEADYQARLKHGLKILSNYHQQSLDEDPQVIETERKIGYGWAKAVLDKDIQLTGKIDRIDWLDKTKKLVRVVDYKTGKPKTKGYIEGTIKSVGLSEREQNLPLAIRGPYKRQLIFYKLLTELDQTFNAEVAEGMFEFVEPYKSNDNRLMHRSFEITQEEVNELKKLIREVMQEIRGLEFLKRE